MTKMKVAAICLSAILLFTSFKNHPDKKQILLMGFGVVELFTSEGCSSCPPADAALAQLKREYANKPVYFLSFHVDYWDNLGWKDQFSDHDYTERQRHYCKLLNVEAYTPQAIFKGKRELIGSETGNLRNLINAAIKDYQSENSIAFSASYKGNKINLKYNLHSVDDDDLVNIALVQERATDKVTAGENKGTVITHVNVVRKFKTVKGELNGKTDMTIPDDLVDKPYRLIVYVQNKTNWHITCGNTVLVSPPK